MSDWLSRLDALSKWSTDIKARIAHSTAEAELLFRALRESPELGSAIGKAMLELHNSDIALRQESNELLAAFRVFIADAEKAGITVAEAFGGTPEQVKAACEAARLDPSEQLSVAVARQLKAPL
jgi:hypothetical protein